MKRCLECNGPFGLVRTYLDRVFHKRQFCSKRCREEWVRKQRKKIKFLRWLLDDS